ncbi:hypothetical protein GGR51DRAFT_547496 [Nemania sp. FL0031]|nr:hypothetical protein GGR51DRAFT_547496 [Nemania sp. FL0031]
MNEPTTAGVRTSGSNPSLRPISNRAGSVRSTSSHFGGHRHALLKSESKVQQSIDKDVPVPPVVTHEGAAQNPRPPRSASHTPAPTEKPVHPSSTDASTIELVQKEILHPSVGGHDQSHSSVSKVRPAVYVNEDNNSGLQSEDQSEILMPSGGVYKVEDHFRHSHTDTPKVRPFVESPSMGAAQSLGANKNTEEAHTPTSVHDVHGQDDEESRKTAIYWGFLPRFREGQKQQHLGTDRQEDRQPMPGSYADSSHPSQAESQRSLNSSQPTNLESGLKQENVRQGDEANKMAAGPTQDYGETKTAPGSSGERSGRSIASASPTSLLNSASGSINKGEELTLPQKLNAGRTARWLRGLLGVSELDDPPTLTKLPEKASSRQGSCEDLNSVASKVTTFSCENLADEKVMSNAMHSLETLITEALSLASKAGTREYGHVDDGNLPLNPTSEGSIRMPSVDESIRRDSSELEGAPFSTHMPNATPGNIGTMITRRKAAPLRSVKRPGLAKAIKRDGKILRPSFLKRIRKASRRTKNGRHTANDDCALPMPLSDSPVYAYPRLGAEYKNDRAGIADLRSGEVPNRREVRKYIQDFHEPPICARGSSKIPCESKESTCDDSDSGLRDRLSEIRLQNMSFCSLDGGTSDEVIEFSTQYGMGEKQHPVSTSPQGTPEHVKGEWPAKDLKTRRLKPATPRKHTHRLRNVSLRNRSHVSIGEAQHFSLTRSSPARKQFVAAVACTSTALIGVLIGIYAGLVPSIQYYIADFHHYTILGNVGLYLGMALSNLLCWPLPLLHGRKPYIVGGLCVAMPLLFPQALAVGTPRSPYTCVWRVALLLPRGLMGFFLGFANMNFHSMLTDLFGASLMSKNPHQEVVDEYDVRRHGGGLGVWLGVWTWCFIGSLSVGFLVGAVVIEYLQPSWGLYISIIIIAVVLLLNVLCPEVRRSAWRRSVAEVRTGERISRRLARGEVMMHRVQTGPRWWGQEMYHGVAMSLEMLRQPGFTIMAVYSAWIYAQIVLVIVLLGSLTSKSYRFRAPYVGAVVSSVAIGAFAAIPFQKANLFSRARSTGPKSNTMTFDRKITWSSRLVRRSIFTLFLPIVGIGYTLVSTGPPIHVVFPCLFAALIGFLSCLAISECNGMMMEAWDCSDLQPGMTGRSTSSKDSHKRTNYSSFPRVTAGWNFIQSLGFIFAAGATALGGTVTRRLGQRAATGVVAGILFVLSLLLLCTLVRFKRVQIIPDCTCSEMDRWKKARRVSLHNWAAAMAEAKEKGTLELNEIPEDDVG